MPAIPITTDSWDNFVATRSAAARERLLREYLPLVRKVAGRMLVSLPRSVRLEDLVSAGSLGLLTSVDNFDPALGIKFETFATSRIRGAMMDSLRELDWVPRSVRQKARQLERATEELTQRLGRAPEEHEVAARLGLTISAFQTLQEEVNVAVLLSLDDSFSGAERDGASLAETAADTAGRSSHDRLEEEELHGLLVEQLKKMPDQDKLVLALYYYEELTFRQIGDVLGLTESRVSQIHSKAIRDLRRSVDHHWGG